MRLNASRVFSPLASRYFLPCSHRGRLQHAPPHGPTAGLSEVVVTASARSMFQSNSIGVSSHRNEYRSGVRVGNWVEELAGREAELAPPEGKDTLKKFMIAQEQRQIALSSIFGQAARAEPKQPVDGNMLFSHGPVFGLNFQASMSALHFTDPATRAYGFDSNDRVHKTFFFGNKHIDRVVPKVQPHPRYELMQAKAPMWDASRAMLRPGGNGTNSPMYDSTASASWSQQPSYARAAAGAPPEGVPIHQPRLPRAPAWAVLAQGTCRA